MSCWGQAGYVFAGLGGQYHRSVGPSHCFFGSSLAFPLSSKTYFSSYKSCSLPSQKIYAAQVCLYRFVGGSDNSGASIDSIPRCLFPALSRPQEAGGMETSNRSVSFESAHKKRPFQDGITPDDSESCSLGDWMLSIDLRDDYFHVPIHLSFQQYLRFSLSPCHFQFRCLPFGLTTSQCFQRFFWLS